MFVELQAERQLSAEQQGQQAEQQIAGDEGRHKGQQPRHRHGICRALERRDVGAMLPRQLHAGKAGNRHAAKRHHRHADTEQAERRAGKAGGNQRAEPEMDVETRQPRARRRIVEIVHGAHGIEHVVVHR